MQPTPEQQHIIEQVAAPSAASLMIRAYAGCAKSSTLQLAAPGIRVPALAAAFNKKIADELRPRLPETFTVKTLNGLGHQAWARTLAGTSIKLDERKLGKLVSAIAKDQRVSLPSWQWDATRQLVTSAMLAGITPNNVGEPLTPDTQESWHDLDLISSQEDFPLTYDLAHQTLVASIALARQGHISFDDQVYCPTVLGGLWPRFPVVFIDESQDLSKLNHAMLQRCLRADGRLIAVGDPKQAIYQFRGADSASMDSMRGLRSEWQDAKLTVTFRCPKTIVARQQDHAPGFQAWNTNQDGAFQCLPAFGGGGDCEDTLSWKWSDITSCASNINARNIAILCRNNAPLLSLAFKLLRRSIGCQCLGRDIGRGLQQLSSKLAPDDGTPTVSVMRAITDWQEREVSLALANDRPERADRITDQSEALIAVLEGSQARDAGELRAMLQKLFARDADPVVLSTIHRAKGLEWPLVIHLDPWRVPSKRARLRGGADLEQELNLIYVCETRTQHTLIHANLEQFR